MVKRFVILMSLWAAAQVSHGAPFPKHQKTLDLLAQKSSAERTQQLASLGPGSYQSLREISFNGQYAPEVRAEAFTVLVSLGKTESRPEVDRALEHKDWFMRALALKAYQWIDSDKAGSVARTLLLQDPALMVRAAALSHLTAEPVTDELKKVFELALKDSKNFHRGQSLFIRDHLTRALERGETHP